MQNNNFSSANTNQDSDTISNNGGLGNDPYSLFEETKEVDVKFDSYFFCTDDSKENNHAL